MAAAKEVSPISGATDEAMTAAAQPLNPPQASVDNNEAQASTITDDKESGPLPPSSTPESTSTKTSESTETAAPATEHVLKEEDTTAPRRGLKVLFLSSDTGGGHRASAESLGNQFELLYPGSTFELLDVASEAYLPPYNSIVSYYKHLSAHPSQWNMLYKVTNSKTMEKVVDTNIRVMTLMCERSMRRKLNAYHADVVVSVHPLMTHVPIQSCAKLSHETGQHMPMFTVVTDLGSAHATWFANGVERMFVGSQQIYQLAKERGKVPEEKLALVGLPIRHDFAVQSEKLGDRMSPQGIAYQRTIREKLKLPSVDRKTMLVMGGGEGVGSLSNIVNALYVELVKQGIDANILVVCGRNEILKQSLENRDWEAIMADSRHKNGHSARDIERATSNGTTLGAAQTTTAVSSMFRFPRRYYQNPITACSETPTVLSGCIEGGVVTSSLRRILSTGSMMSAASGSAVVVPPSPVKDDIAVFQEKKVEDGTHGLTKKSNSIGAIDYHPRDEDDHIHCLGNAISVEESANGDEEHEDEEYTVSVDNLEIEAIARADSSRPPMVVAKASSSDSSKHSDRKPAVDDVIAPGQVSVVGLGFVSNMAEYMVAADILISKAGPGTISEAAAVSLPVMLTSFLPGQEEGNVDYVIDGGFGSYCHDSDPQAIAEEVALWLTDPTKLAKLSAAAKAKGAPYAARDIVKQIGESALAWRAINEAAKVESKK